jgi:hypothetical protein
VKLGNAFILMHFEFCPFFSLTHGLCDDEEESSQLGFSSLFVLVFLVYMSAIKVYLKGEEVQCLKEETFEGKCINRKRVRYLKFI